MHSALLQQARESSEANFCKFLKSKNRIKLYRFDFQTHTQLKVQTKSI